jgi:hypothetical protein
MWHPELQRKSRSLRLAIVMFAHISLWAPRCARTVAGALAGAAEHEFGRAYGHLPPSQDKDFIAGLIPWVFERT